MLKGPGQALFGAHFVAYGIGTWPRRITKKGAATQQPQPRLSAQVNWQLGASHPPPGAACVRRPQSIRQAQHPLGNDIELHFFGAPRDG